MSGAPHTPLSSADTAWLHMDRPTNLMVINSILLFGKRVDWERFEEVIRTRLLEPYPRFGERAVESRLVTGGVHWEPDPEFDLARHLHRRGLAAPGDEHALQALAGDLASTPLDREKPLWDMYLIDGPGEGSAAIVRMHHCIADGIALAQVMLSLTDPRAAGTVRGTGKADAAGTAGAATIAGPPAEPGSHQADAGTHGTIGAVRGLAGTVVRESARTLTHPRRVLELAGGAVADAQALSKLLLTPADADSVLAHGQGATRCVAWSRPMSLDRIKAIAHAHGATVNDVLLAAVSGALRRYLTAHGEEPHELRALVPVNLRPIGPGAAAELGNRFGLVYLTLPVDRAGARERLYELKQRMDAIKHSPEGPVSYVLLETAGLAPAGIERYIIDFFTAKASAVITNVPGPRETVYMAGSPLRTVLVWAPTAGSVGMSVSVFSYDGRVTVGLLTHTAQVPNPQAIVGRLHLEVATLARLAPPAPPADGRSGRAAARR